jgi:hypothetical protein
MSKAYDKALETYPIIPNGGYSNNRVQQERRNACTKGYELAINDIKEELDKRLELLWDKLPDGNDFLTGKETIEGAANLGQYRAIESFLKYVEGLITLK